MSPFLSLRRPRTPTHIRSAFLVLTAVLLAGAPASVGSGDGHGKLVLFREEFDSLDRWKPLVFRKIRDLSTYSVENGGNGESYVIASSSGSASGMVWKGQFDVYEYPMIRWRWKISNVYSGGNALEKAGDDYPMRIYVMFKYDTDDPNVRKKFKYGLARLLYGEYPPYASLTYIWANREHRERFIPNPFAAEAMMVPLRAGAELAGRWVPEERDVLNDYREAFGTDPPRTAGIAFMNDSDNTGESSRSWIDYIEVYRDAEGSPEKGGEPEVQDP